MLPVLSIWQPYARLAVSGIKKYETRPFPCPPKYIGQRIGIASTKQIRREQLELTQSRAFQRAWRRHYLTQGDLNFLFHPISLGCILGTVRVAECLPIDRKLMRQVGATERAFGWWEPGRFAWRLEDPQLYDTAIYTRGGQGIWHYHGPQA